MISTAQRAAVRSLIQHFDEPKVSAELLQDLLDALDLAEAQSTALKAAIEAAPHGIACPTQNRFAPAGDCECWKADVLRMWRPKA